MYAYLTGSCSVPITYENIYSDGTHGNRHNSYTDCVEPVNVIEIRGWNTVVLEVQSLYFRWLLSGIFCGYITNNIVIVVYPMCELRPVALVVYLDVKTPGYGGYWPEHNMYVCTVEYTWCLGKASCSSA
jgi:hypothetical protein